MTRDYILGAALGVGLAATGFYLYKKNQNKIDDILRSHGMDIPVNENKALDSMSIEELASMKEKIEDLIAERELAAKEQTQDEKPKAKAKKSRSAAPKAQPAA